jgi:hypothetical protein
MHPTHYTVLLLLLEECYRREVYTNGHAGDA